MGREQGGDPSRDLIGRADALDRAAALARGRLPEPAVEAAVETVSKVRARLRHGTDRTVIALAGPTGVGKSSLFNAVVGAEVSTPGVKRPTTSVAHAALWGGDEPRLLRWLEVSRRYLVEPASVDSVPDTERPTSASSQAHSESGATRLDGLIVIDLPDVDSVETSNRQEAERLIEVVDALIWVVDPQKYADEVVHAQIAALSSHADVMRFALTKMDLVAADEHDRVIADFTKRLHDDGVIHPVVWPVAIGDADAPGLATLRDGLAEIVATQRALIARLDADLKNAAGALSDRLTSGTAAQHRTDPSGKGSLPDRIREVAVDEVSAAARSNELAEAVSVQYRRGARRATGWLPIEWVRRRRPDPVAQLARPGSIDRLRIESALRESAEIAAADLGAPWDGIVRREAISRADDVADALRTRSVNVARHVGAAPRWWTLFSSLQRLLLLCVFVGVAWLGLAAIAGGLGLDTDPLIIRIGPTPIPSALVIGGVALGIACGLIARLPAHVGGARRARAVSRHMRAETAEVLEREVVGPIEQVLADRMEIDRLVGIAAGAEAFS